MSKEPTTDERLKFYRDNAEAFVTSISAMVDALRREGKRDFADKLNVWALMPWRAALRDDRSGDLWLICEICSEPIKDDAEHASSEDCHFHRKCVDA